MYEDYKTQRDLNFQLLVGLKKHLEIANNTSNAKSIRNTSLSNMEQVLNYVLPNLNDTIPKEESAIYERFFTLLLIKIVKAKITLHSKPENFLEEINFISVLLKL